MVHKMPNRAHRRARRQRHRQRSILRPSAIVVLVSSNPGRTDEPGPRWPEFPRGYAVVVTSLLRPRPARRSPVGPGSSHATLVPACGGCSPGGRRRRRSGACPARRRCHLRATTRSAGRRMRMAVCSAGGLAKRSAGRLSERRCRCSATSLSGKPGRAGPDCSSSSGQSKRQPRIRLGAPR